MNKTSVIDLIGNTPLIYLKKPSEISGCNIYGKAEFLNPGQSVKDRAALYIINDALNKKLLETGGTIVEGTAGNTGIGIAMVEIATTLMQLLSFQKHNLKRKKYIKKSRR